MEFEELMNLIDIYIANEETKEEEEVRTTSWTTPEVNVFQEIYTSNKYKDVWRYIDQDDSKDCSLWPEVSL